MRKKTRVIITIVLSIIELVFIYIVLNVIQTLISKEIVEFYKLIAYITPAPILYLGNYYFFAPLIYKIGIKLWHLLFYRKYLSKKYNEIINKSINWLISINTKWGPNIFSNEKQNANTCEVLISLRKTGLYKEKKQIYKDALSEILNNSTDSGLASKSLNMSTVVCTSMMLYLLSYEQKDSVCSISDYCKYDTIYDLLWRIRCKNGWGVYMEETTNDNCSLANTFWALTALINYKSSIISIDEIIGYLKSIYEYSVDGKFGFFVGDKPNLVTTSMYLILYYRLNPKERKQLSTIYDYKKAIDYVFELFIKKGIQCETETLIGIDRLKTGAKKAPWNHISAGFAIEALILAYKSKDLRTSKANTVFKRIDSILKDNTVLDNNTNTCYYMPEGLSCRQGNVFTFPTTYLVNGLNSIN